MKKTRLAALLLAGSLLLPLTACAAEPTGSLPAEPSSSEPSIAPEEPSRPAEPAVKITPAAVRSADTEVYESPDFTMTIPKGWTVTTGGINMYHSIRVSDPDEPLNQMFILLKADCLLHSQAGKDAWQYNYELGNTQAALLASAPVLPNPSTEGFYQIFPQYVDFVTQMEPTYAGYTFPTFENFTVTDYFSAADSLQDYALGDGILRATFTDENGAEGEGMFAAAVVDFGSYPIANGQTVDYQLKTVDGGYYIAYNVMAITAVKDTFLEWEEFLTSCMKTLQYSDSFVSAANQASNEAVARAQDISANFNQIADGILSSWIWRNKSVDILSQKQSDAILGYERVIDNETNVLYRVPSGWSDIYDGHRYRLVTDDDAYYNPISGYIELE